MINANSSGKARPARSLRAVDLSSANATLAVPCRAFFVGSAGSVVIIAPDDTASVIIVSGDAQYHPIEVKTFVRAGTTATNIVALF